MQAMHGAVQRRNTMPRNLDLIVFGATGFTGRLVVEHLLSRYGVGGEVAWAMAGRSLTKMHEVRRHIGADDALPLLEADASDAASLGALVSQARAIVTTVGPYQQHGQALVTACAHAGTDYLDLCGEPLWMAQMIPHLQTPARASGARIVFSCGFDSIPFDLGVVFLQDEALRRFAAPLRQVHARVRVMKGGFSGGTMASALATIEQLGREPELTQTLADPFALTPGFRGPAQPAGEAAEYDPVARAWTAPFIMAPINTKNVHRTNALRGHPWGRDFIYDERMLCGDGAAGQGRARAMARNARMQTALLRFAPARALLRRFVLPKPGEGPSAHERDTGCYEVLFSGEASDGRRLQALVRGDRDPGYGSTSKMIAEAALCLLDEVGPELAPGGVWTPGAAMGLALVRRLQARAGLQFSIVADQAGP
jgi:short subunit dehydrogenase-like uncharacterized protein